jgi:hypothetical protein
LRASTMQTPRALLCCSHKLKRRFSHYNCRSLTSCSVKQRLVRGSK